LTTLHVLISGSASNVATKGARAVIKYVVHETDHEEQEREEEEEGLEYDAVFEKIIVHLEQSSSKHFATGSKARDLISIVAHRVVHGGVQSEPMMISKGHEQGLQILDKLSEFAPLHNHRSITTVRSCLTHLPSSTQILLFDTLFHQSIPDHVSTYPLAPSSSQPPIPLKKYGAHGLSYSSVLTDVAKFLGKEQQQCNLILAHLGSGASVCMVKSGKSYDTSMGVSPLDGLPGGTRTGSVDPVLIFHHTPDCSATVEYQGVSLSKAEMIMNKEGGLQAVCGTSDFAQILSRLSSPSTPPDTLRTTQMGYALYLDRLLNYLGSYTLKLVGSLNREEVFDGIVFSGGIGERAAKLRADVAKYFDFLGVEIDPTRNDGVKDDSEGGNVTKISKDGAKFSFFVCKTDEETQCAKMAKAWMAKQ